ncbi:hypothetical protein HDU83_003054 [Entophlyctis luteolus]|nr:hypothetical protein HDU83_003054 [Entophlyctis luteolus]KAJ3384320.1 hypothetical protein HDU84_003042 [Entophlyctis sp. JEL0112]
MSGRYKDDDDDFDDDENDDIEEDYDQDDDDMDEDLVSSANYATLPSSSAAVSASAPKYPKSSHSDSKPAPVVKFKLPATHHDPTSDAANASLLETNSVLPIKVREDVDRTPAAAVKFIASQTSEIYIPSYATWFQHDKIHHIEKKALPEFFSNKNKSKTPEVYKEHRTFMINTYRLNPTEYLTVTACRRNLAGDVCSILRVHSFLEQWGLINFQVDAESRPSLMGPSFTSQYAVTADAPRGLIPFGPVVPTTKNASDESNVDPLGAGSSTDPANVVLSNGYNYLGGRKRSDGGAVNGEDLLSDAKRTKISCRTCGVDCSQLRYNVQFENEAKDKQQVLRPFDSGFNNLGPQDLGFNLCKGCYVDGRFPSNLYSGDFVRVTDSSSGPDFSAPWSDQETLLLLEGIELYDQDWARIAQHVGTRSKDACVLKFLQIPIVDDTVQEYGQACSRIKLPSAKELGPFAYGRLGGVIPVTGSDNPVVTVVALLASLVRPSVAQSSARAAIAANSLDQKKTFGDPVKVETNFAPSVKIEHGLENGSKRPESKMKQAATTTNRVVPDAAEARRLKIKAISLHRQKMLLKLRRFEELEAAVEAETNEVEKERKVVLAERLQLKKERAELRALLAQANARENGAAERRLVSLG